MAELITPKSSGNGYKQASTSNYVSSSISNAPGEVSISISEQDQSGERRIQKVPAFLRGEEHNKRDYDPAIVSFGPYHHGKSELKLAEDFKPRSLELFADGSREIMELCLNEVRTSVPRLRSCYVENSTDKYDCNAFAEMMLYDACFIINMIYKTPKIKENMENHLGLLGFKLIYRDMLLLENQIPFFLLKSLIGLRSGYEIKTLEDFVRRFCLGKDNEQTGESKKEEEEPLHLLEAFRRILVVVDCKDYNRGIDKKKKSGCLDNYSSVLDLKAKGIHFTPSGTRSLKGIKFEPSYIYAKLQLPIWYVSIYTKVFFLNMIAFEMCPHTQTDQTVSSYMKFMKSLIDSPKDVKELRQKKIILNQLGSDEQVLQVYKDINTYGANDDSMFDQEKQNILYHYNNKAKTWLAEFIHTYFRSPWSAIALLAASFILCLTIVQTYFTIHPSSDN